MTAEETKKHKELELKVVDLEFQRKMDKERQQTKDNVAADRSRRMVDTLLNVVENLSEHLGGR